MIEEENFGAGKPTDSARGLMSLRTAKRTFGEGRMVRVVLWGGGETRRMGVLSG